MLYIKFHTIPTSFGLKYKSHVLLATKSTLPATTAFETSILQLEPMDDFKILPRESVSSFGVNLTLFDPT